MHPVQKPIKHHGNSLFFLTIDPGLRGHTGYALFSTDEKEKKPLRNGLVIAKTKMMWYEECSFIARNLGALEWTSKLDEVFIEMPEFWSGSAKSFASTEQGSLFKLAFLVGDICGYFHRKLIPVTLLSPREWKGQMSKEMVNRRIKYILGEKYGDHVSDAVGMGLFVKGLI